ncbi:TetR/AcrR family transcriptional regulator [Ruegeria sp. HKCCD6157]|uniref:TetR/AcrR family transcriptional regulator n=1 Tax=Ruegeria sp. HKCCD6157 TaxID=2690707 RepID=UPI0014918DCB|nr:TetR family transcriptional regulator [Ruegeria sp. HKCCD6157]NOE25062.1 TetR family transcriptional regulator [Ruegeria sp. HKCCD6157]
MRPNKRDELVSKALKVFYRDGFHATGMDKLVVETGVSKTSMYKHFRTKEDLIVAALRLRDENFRNWFFQRIDEMAETPADQIIVSFDALKEWFEEDGFRGCMFIKAGAEYQDKDHPIHVQAAEHKQLLLEHFTAIAQQAGAHDPRKLASQIVLLQEGAIVSAVLLKNCDPAEDAKDAAKHLLAKALA